MAFRRRDFRDELVTFGPNDEVADLRHYKFDDSESLRVIDSLKIFDRVSYNSSPEHDAPANPHKGRRRPGRRR
ncbi:MAG TPA: hypothetical protein VF588_00025 [Pyrinomonadaceae bacterium]|jgi:hypothetical protein